MAVLLGNLLALSFIDNFAVLLGHILTQLLLDSAALLVVGDLADSLGVGDTLLLIHRLALSLQLGAALLVRLCVTLLLVDDLGDGPGHVDTLQLGHGVALLLLLGVALLGDVISSFTVLFVGESALLTLNLFLNRALGDLTLPLLDSTTDLVRHLGTLSLGHRVVLHWTWHLSALLDWLLVAHLLRHLLSGGPGHLVTHLLGHLSAHWLGRSSLDAGVGLVRQTRDGENNTQAEQSLHLDGDGLTDLVMISMFCS